MTFDLEKARAICARCCAPFSDVTDEHVSLAMCQFYESLAEIERLRADNAGLSKAVIDIQEGRDLAQAEFRTYHKAWEEQAARIRGLEAEAQEYHDRAEELAGMLAKSWQITEERKAAITRIIVPIECVLVNDETDSDIENAVGVLRAMLEEAGL